MRFTTRKLFALLLATSFSQLAEAQPVGQIPMYGAQDRNADATLRAVDEKLIADTTRHYGSRERASEASVGNGLAGTKDSGPLKNADSTCHVAVPPPTAGEGGVHAQLFRVYPRKKAIGSKFNGCQTIWLYAAGESGAKSAPINFIRFYFSEGKVVAVRTEDSVCRYTSTGVQESGNTAACPSNAPEAMPSQPAGCISHRKSQPSANCDDDA